MSAPDMSKRARGLAEAFDRSFQLPALRHAEEGRAALAIHAGGHPYLLPVEGVSMVSRAPKIVPLPLRLATPPTSPRSQLGLAGIRGELVGVFSLAGLLGHDAPDKASWLAVARGDRPVALAFEALDGQVVVPTASIIEGTTEPRPRPHIVSLVLLAGETSARGLLDLESLVVRLSPSGGA